MQNFINDYNLLTTIPKLGIISDKEKLEIPHKEFYGGKMT